MTTMSNDALRLQASMMEELKKVVAEEGTTINQFINVAVAEKLAALRTQGKSGPCRYGGVLGDFGTSGHRGAKGGR